MATVMFPTAGLGELLDAMAATVTYIGVGSGNTEPALADTELDTEITRVAISNSVRSGAQLSLDAFFTTGQGNGTIREAGILDASVAGNLWTRGLTDSDVVKTATKQMLVTFTITAANG